MPGARTTEIEDFANARPPVITSCLHMMIVSTGEVPSATMTIRFVLVSVLASLFLTVNAPSRAVAVEDRFQQAVNYVFTGRIDPENGPQIVDPKACAVLVPEPKFNRYARYHLTRFKMETARISKKYAGSRTIYELEVEGDDTLLEYLKADKTTVDYGFRSAHIALPGDPDQTEKALALIFSQYCKVEKPRRPF